MAAVSASCGEPLHVDLHTVDVSSLELLCPFPCRSGKRVGGLAKVAAYRLPGEAPASGEGCAKADFQVRLNLRAAQSGGACTVSDDVWHNETNPHGYRLSRFNSGTLQFPIELIREKFELNGPFQLNHFLKFYSLTFEISALFLLTNKFRWLMDFFFRRNNELRGCVGFVRKNLEKLQFEDHVVENDW